MNLKDFYKKYNYDISELGQFGLTTAQSVASGIGDLVDAQYAQSLDNQAIADANTDYSIGALFSNASNLNNSLQSIDNNIQDVSDVNDMASLYGVTNPNMYQNQIKGPNQWQDFGNAMAQTAKGFAEGAQTGNLLVAGVDAALRFVGAGLRSNQIKRNVALQNDRIAKANQKQIDYINDQMTDIAQTNTRNQMRNMFALGGDVENSTGVNAFNVGGSHETNPLGGIPQGIAADNVPNLVQEGEVKVTFPGPEKDSEIFSNELKASKAAVVANNLDKKYIGWYWADIIKDLQKEMEPRGKSNIISNNGFYTMAERARAGQAYDRQRKQQKEMVKFINSLPNEEKAPMYASGDSILKGKKYYKNGGVLEGDFDVDDLTKAEIQELNRLGFNVEIL